VLPPIPRTASPSAMPLTPTESPTPTRTAVPISLLNNPVERAQAQKMLSQEGLLILAMRDGYYTHLFAYHPLYLALTPLTGTPWDDITPAISPDGKRLAYASRQNGYWDLYILDLETGRQTRLTDTPEYEGSPTWSSDGLWVAFEKYTGASMDIFIMQVDEPKTPPIQLTDDPGSDRSPAWSPNGREIAFISTRSGDEEVWLANLDNIDSRFTNLSRSPQTQDRYPVWSQDGKQLAWSADKNGSREIVTWVKNQPGRPVGAGSRAVWSPDGQVLFSEADDPNQSGLTAYEVSTRRMTLPLESFSGQLYGMTWVRGPLPEWLNEIVQRTEPAIAPTLWQPIVTRTALPNGRKGLSPLPDVSAPLPLLHDEADEAFNALRQIISTEAGWDALSSLENAYMALTAPNTPSIQDDWLYTGRAFALNPLLLSAGWMSITREDYEGQAYWRVYLKARYQDGSMGIPLTEMAWDLNARYQGDTRAYEQGGQVAQVPQGYWIDLTELALRFGWERLPSQTNWRTFYPSIRFNQFVMTGGLSWYQAMAEIYPPEALVTATPLPTYTPIPSDTPEETTVPPTVTPTRTATTVPTRRPTWTPLPGLRMP